MSSYRSRLSSVAVIFATCAIILAIAVSASAQSSGSHPIPATDYTIEGARYKVQSTSKPSIPQGDGTWTSTSAVNAPAPRRGQSTIWSGTEMIIWGGTDGSYGAPSVNTGARYNPTTDTWQALPTVGAPPANSDQPAIWTGKEMIVGIGGGGRYNPATNSWKPITTTGSPTSADIVVWTGHEMLVWQRNGTGARYDPDLDKWTPISSIGAPSDPLESGPSVAAGVWTGQEMVVFFSCSPVIFINCGGYTGTGGRYNPVTDTWRSMSSVDAPLLKRSPGAVVWTGKEMVVYGGFNNFTSPPGPNMGGKYNPATDTWAFITPLSDFEYSDVTTAIWTGYDVVFAGRDPFTPNTRVARYDPVTDQWNVLPPPICNYGSLVWTGKEILLWGANTYAGCFIQDNAARRYTMPYRTTQLVDADSDTYIAQGRPTTAFGSDPVMFSGFDPQYGFLTERMLLHFPVGIPVRTKFERATAYLYMYAYNNDAAPMSISAHRATGPWDESSTWQTSANNFDSALSSAVSVGTAFDWYEWDITSIAAGWLSGTPNYGLMLNGNTSGSRNERAFLAREAGADAAPFLAITHTDPAYAVDSTPPAASLLSLPIAHDYKTPVTVAWVGTDNGRGVQNFDVQVRNELTGVWNDWYSWAVGRSAYFAGEVGHTYCFRVRARDYAGNVGSWSTDDRCTTFSYAYTGAIVDHRHTPIANAALQIHPAAFATTVNPHTGQYTLYFVDDQPRQITATQWAYAVPPAASLAITATDRYDFVMQPTDNVVLNSNFESGFAGWTVSGTLPVSITRYSHSGSLAARLNSESTSGIGTASVMQSLAIPAAAVPQVLSFMVHLTATAPLGNSQLTVTLATTDTVSTIWSAQANCALWCHAWIDVSAWSGQNVTVTMGLTQATGETLQATLDEIVLGSWQTPIVERVVPARIEPQIGSVITLTGRNFLAQPLSSAYITGPKVSLNTTPIDTYWITTNTVTATVPATMPWGIYTVWMTNPGGFSGALPDSLQIAHVLFLPFIARSN